jgi:hypothetical protein
MNAKTVLEIARSLVTGDRAQSHGDMKQNMNQAARLWTVHLNGRSLLTAEDVAIMMALLKISRISSGQHNDDNYIDLAGYAAIAGQVSE